MSGEEPSPYGLSEAVILRIISVFASMPEIEQVLLYGSRAKGTFKNGSDIDMVVCGELVSHSMLLSLEQRLDDLLLPQTIDISLLHEIDNPDLLDHIKRVGIPVYEKGTAQHSNL